MATEKSIKPTNLVPRSFGGEKNNFSNDLIANGYEVNAPQTYNGDNLNYQLDATGKELDYCEKVVDYINGLGVGKTPIVNANNKLDETQVGLKVYSATETYSLGEWVRSGDKIYQSQTQGNVGNELTNETYWKEVELGGGYRPPLLSCMWVDHKLDDIQWLRGDTFSWQDSTVHSAVYSLLLEEYNNTASTEQTENGITFKVTPRGFRIADATQEQAILDLYNTKGVAWYYIIDPTNTRFKLPRTKYGFVGLRDSVGGYVAESLPNITCHQTGAVGANVLTNNGALIYTPGGHAQGLAGTTSSSVNFNGTFDFNASRSSSTYQNNAPVQQRATQMYLYFYVGEYTKTAVEQTAGLNAELFNGKMDRDLSNRTSNIHFVTETYQNGYSWYRVYSDGWCEQGGLLQPSSNSTILTFLKPFSNLNYTPLVTASWASVAAQQNEGVFYADITKTSMNVTVSSVPTYVWWQAQGYIK